MIVWVNGRPRGVHRIVMETLLGRPLRTQEFVHHINGDPHDNRPENLAIMRGAAHTAAHLAKNPLVIWCARCGKPSLFLRHKGWRKAFYCSRRCAMYSRWERVKKSCRPRRKRAAR